MKQKLYGFKHEWCVMCIGFGFGFYAKALYIRSMGAKRHCHTLHAPLENAKREEGKKAFSIFVHFAVKGCVVDKFRVRLSMHEMRTFVCRRCVQYSQINDTK